MKSKNSEAASPILSDILDFIGKISEIAGSNKIILKLKLAKP